MVKYDVLALNCWLVLFQKPNRLRVKLNKNIHACINKHKNTN